MAVVVRCPTCRKKFSWKAGIDSLPDECPLCDAPVASNRPDDDVVMPSLRAARTSIADKVYRDMERGSEHRMHLAAEAAGVPVSEMANLKITNLNDRRDAEIPAIEDKAAVARLTNGKSDQAGTFFRANGAEAAVGVSDGSFMLNGKRVGGDPKSARAGMQAMQKFQGLMGKG